MFESGPYTHDQRTWKSLTILRETLEPVQSKTTLDSTQGPDPTQSYQPRPSLSFQTFPVIQAFLGHIKDKTFVMPHHTGEVTESARDVFYVSWRLLQISSFCTVYLAYILGTSIGQYFSLISFCVSFAGESWQGSSFTSITFRDHWEGILQDTTNLYGSFVQNRKVWDCVACSLYAWARCHHLWTLHCTTGH